MAPAERPVQRPVQRLGSTTPIHSAIVLPLQRHHVTSRRPPWQHTPALIGRAVPALVSPHQCACALRFFLLHCFLITRSELAPLRTGEYYHFRASCGLAMLVPISTRAAGTQRCCTDCAPVMLVCSAAASLGCPACVPSRTHARSPRHSVHANREAPCIRVCRQEPASVGGERL